MRESRNGSGSRWWGWVVASAAVAVVLAGVGAWLLVDPLSVDEPKDRASTMQAALAIAFGFGGLATLGLFTRRQWHQERVAEDARHDAEQRRITEQYVQAVEQLGHEKAPVRLGGLYALDRLGRNHPEQRQVIAEVWCAYLRRRYTPPPEVLGEAEESEEGRAGGAGEEGREGGEEPARSEEQRKADTEAAEEYEVRMTAQRLLARHLKDPRSTKERDDARPAESEEYWHLESIDLTGAVLIDADFQDCRFPPLKAERVRFCRSALFSRAYFEGDAGFREARFGGGAWFGAARFGGDAWFEAARFGGVAGFEEARFESGAWFDAARFEGVVMFAEARFEPAVGAAEGPSMTASLVNMADAVVDRIDFGGPGHVWPPGWGTMADGDKWKLVPVEE